MVSGIAVFSAYASLFGLVQSYPSVIAAIGAPANCLVYAFFCLALAATAVVWLPETNGVPKHEVRELLEQWNLVLTISLNQILLDGFGDY